jgi:intracellular sulfur oxidation DsrE/DsrF family protein
MEDGVKFYLCWNTLLKQIENDRIILPGNLIGGVGLVRSGVGALADFIKSGYVYVNTI